MSAAPRQFRRRSYSQGQNFSSAPAAVAPQPPARKLEIQGDRHLWVRLQKISDAESGTATMTYAMAVPGGLLINTKTRTPHGVSEALVYLPGAGLAACASGLTIVPSKSA